MPFTDQPDPSFKQYLPRRTAFCRASVCEHVQNIFRLSLLESDTGKKWILGFNDLLLNFELLTKFYHHILPITGGQECSNNDNGRTSVLNNHVSKPSSGTNFASVTYIRPLFNKRLLHWCQDGSNWRLSIELSTFAIVLYPLCDYHVRYNYPINKIHLFHLILLLYDQGLSSNQSSHATAFYISKLQNSSK